MKAVRGTLRLWVLVLLIGWTIAVAIPIIFQGGSVSSIPTCPDGSYGCQPTGWPWGVTWVVGCLVILAIGFVTRKRA